MKVYDKVKYLLETFPECKDSDKKLLWRYWSCQINKTSQLLDSIDYHDFNRLVSAESITRARRAVQEHHEELRASKKIEEARSSKANNPHQWLY